MHRLVGFMQGGSHHGVRVGTDFELKEETTSTVGGCHTPRE